MTKRITSRIKTFLLCTDNGPRSSNGPNEVDVREEYANAFRTESYMDFWTRVLDLAAHDKPTSQFPVDSTTAARLPSYRLFAEHLLDPNQPTITKILSSAHHGPIYHSLLSDYFTQTSNASLVCSLLLKEIDRTRVRHRRLKTIIEHEQLSLESHFQHVVSGLVEFSNCTNSFIQFAPSSRRVQTIQDECIRLLKRLELSRDKLQTKLERIKNITHGSAIFLVALTTSLTLIVLTHGIGLLVATPGLIMVTFELTSSKKLAKVSAQLDTAAKGTYTLNRDLDTISRLVTRLTDELEYMKAMIKFWLERREDRLRAVGEAARELKKNYGCFRQRLDELEEHLYLCFMTINRARNLVVKEILDPSRPAKAPFI